MRFISPTVHDFIYARVIGVPNDDIPCRDMPAIFRTIKPESLNLRITVCIIGRGNLTCAAFTGLLDEEVQCWCHQEFKLVSRGISDDIRDFTIRSLRPIKRCKIRLARVNSAPCMPGDFLRALPRAYGEHPTNKYTQPIIDLARSWFFARYIDKPLGILMPSVTLEAVGKPSSGRYY